MSGINRIRPMNTFRANRRDAMKLGAAGLVAIGGTGRGLPSSVAAQTPVASAPAVQMGERRDLIVGTFGDPGNLNPLIRSDIPGSLIQYNLNENLVWPNYQTREMDAGLAESWASTSPTTWRIKLREGVQWHKGYGEVTANDLAYHWNYAIENQTYQAPGALFPVVGVTVVDKYVAEVELKQPFGGFPPVTMGYGGQIVSEAAHKELGDEEYSNQGIGCGPFILESWNRGSEVIARKNPEYWRPGYPYLDEIVWRIVPDSHVRLQMLQTGEVDFINSPDRKDVAAVREDSEFQVTSTPGWNWDYQEFTFPPFIDAEFPNQDKLVRQAISYAIDREAIVQQIYNGEATATDNPIPPGFLGHEGSLLKYPKNADLDKARELMQQAGVEGYEVEVITSDKDWLRRELELVASMVSEIGITYNIRGMDLGSFNNLWLNREYQQLLEDITITSPDPDSTMYWFLHTDTSSWGGYDNPDVDKWLDDARASNDQEERASLYHNVVAQTLEDCPFIYHVNVNYVRIFRQGLEGFESAPQEYMERFYSTYWSE